MNLRLTSTTTAAEGMAIFEALNRPRRAVRQWSHAELVTLAVRWLKRTKRCGVVLQEPAAIGGESPDAIGWRGGFSLMVECKVSRNDFLADQKKRGRVEGRRLAWRCYYLAPAGLLKPEEIPEPWGLLEAREGGAHLVKDVSERIRDFDDRAGRELRDEVLLLYGELRRYHVQGITYQTITKRVAQKHLLDALPGVSE